jgi:cell shape-determining protein MreC
MKSFAIATLAAAVSAAPISGMEFKFINYLAKYSKSYATVEEYETRLEVFAAKEYEITQHNANNTQWKMGHNKFSDRTVAEMDKML